MVQLCIFLSGLALVALADWHKKKLLALLDYYLSAFEPSGIEITGYSKADADDSDY